MLCGEDEQKSASGRWSMDGEDLPVRDATSTENFCDLPSPS